MIARGGLAAWLNAWFPKTLIYALVREPFHSPTQLQTHRRNLSVVVCFRAQMRRRTNILQLLGIASFAVPPEHAFRRTIKDT